MFLIVSSESKVFSWYLQKSLCRFNVVLYALQWFWGKNPFVNNNHNWYLFGLFEWFFPLQNRAKCVVMYNLEKCLAIDVYKNLLNWLQKKNNHRVLLQMWIKCRWAKTAGTQKLLRIAKVVNYWKYAVNARQQSIRKMLYIPSEYPKNATRTNSAFGRPK